MKDRHIGIRENIWFPVVEHDDMLACMATLKEDNKSVFIRTCVKNFINYYKEQLGKKEQ